MLWIESKFQDFIDGIISDGLYVSKGVYQEQDSGCIEFCKRFDFNGDGYFDLTSADLAGPYLKIFFGSSQGYSPSNSRLFPVATGGGVFIADLNLDTYPELIHAGHQYEDFCKIYWGTPNGPFPSNYTALPNHQAEAVYVHDINKDGWLDIILSGWEPMILTIYFGSRNGYSQSNSIHIYMPYRMVHNLEVADINKDGWSDILAVLPTQAPGNAIIYWGPNNSYTIRWLPLDIFNRHGLSIADFDKNGWLDIVCTVWRVGNNARIFFGSSIGFDSIPPVTLSPGEAYGGSAVWDFNNDGWLDILIFNYGNYGLKIYRNIGHYPYFDENNTIIIAQNIFFSASGGCIGDFNFDGNIDIWVNNLNSYSYILWGPDYINHTPLPVNSDHHGYFMEIGNTYNREFYEEYISNIFYLGPDSVIKGGTASWISTEPSGSKVEVYLRSGNNSQIDTSWTDWIYIPQNGGSIPPSLFDKHYLQYKILFKYQKPTFLPNLEKISFNILTSPLSYLNIFPDSTSFVHPNDSVIYKLKAVYVGETQELVYFYPHGTNPGWSSKIKDTLGNLIDTILLIPNDTFAFNLIIHSPLYPSPFESDTTFLKGYLISNPLKRDSAKIITNIQGDIKILIEPDTQGVTVPGTVVKYPMRVINGGEFKDSILLSYINSSNSYLSYFTDSSGSTIINFVKTYPSDTSKILLWVFPLPSTPDSHNVTKVFAKSSWNTNIYDSSIVITYLYYIPYLLVEPDTFSYANPGEKIKYKLRVINNTDSNDTINLSFHHNQNWDAKITDTFGNIIDKIIVFSKDTGFIFFEVQVPENVSGGVRDTAFIKGISKNTGSKDSARCITEVKISAIVQIGPDQEKIGSPGEIVKYYLKVINLGNAIDTINLFIILSKWTQNVIYDSLTNLPLKDNNNDGYQDVILSSGSSHTIFLYVNIPENATPEEKDSTVIRANSTNSPNIYDDANLLTRVQKIFTLFKIEPDTEIYIPYNSSILIPVHAFFKGNSKDYVEIEWNFYGKDLNVVLKDSAGIRELIDNNQNGNIDLGLCSPEKKNYFSIYVKAPDFNYSSKDTVLFCNIKLKGYLFSSSSLYDTAKIKIFLIPPLHIHNYESPFFAREGTNFFISVPENGKGTLEIYSRLGEKIITLFKNKPLSRGIHIIPWNGKNERGNYVAPGVYIYIFEFKGEKISKTIIKKTGVKG